MLINMTFIIATFMAPENIATDIKSMFLMLPLLAAVALVYKATKTRVIFPRKFFREVFFLFCTISVFMTLTAAALNVVVWILTK